MLTVGDRLCPAWVRCWIVVHQIQVDLSDHAIQLRSFLAIRREELVCDRLSSNQIVTDQRSHFIYQWDISRKRSGNEERIVFKSMKETTESMPDSADECVRQVFKDAPTELQESCLEEFRFVVLSYWFRPDWSFHG